MAENLPSESLNIRESLKKIFFQSTGISEFSTELFLEVEESDPYSEQERETIQKTFEDFIFRTQRF